MIHKTTIAEDGEYAPEIGPWVSAFGRMIAMVQGSWEASEDLKITLQIRLRDEDAAQTPIVLAGMNVDTDHIYAARFTCFDADGNYNKNFFVADSLAGCHYDFRWITSGDVDPYMYLQGIVKTFAEIPSYLR